MEIEFQTADQLLRCLFELAPALHNDYEQLESLVSYFVPISLQQVEKLVLDRFCFYYD